MHDSGWHTQSQAGQGIRTEEKGRPVTQLWQSSDTHGNQLPIYCTQVKKNIPHIVSEICPVTNFRYLAGWGVVTAMRSAAGASTWHSLQVHPCTLGACSLQATVPAESPHIPAWVRGFQTQIHREPILKRPNRHVVPGRSFWRRPDSPERRAGLKVIAELWLEGSSSSGGYGQARICGLVQHGG